MSRASTVGKNLLRLAFAVLIFAYLFHRLNNSVHEVSFVLAAPARPLPGDIMTDAANPDRNFTVIATSADGLAMTTVFSGKDVRSLPDRGSLRPVTVSGVAAPPQIRPLEWRARKITAAGIRISAGVFSQSLDKWELLLLAFLLFPAATAAITMRWRLVLTRQGVPVPFARCLSASFIGQFFNWFALGATGGDIAKAYFISMETEDLKPEVATSVFVDRLLGLPSLILFADVVMLARVRFFLAYPLTRASLYFMAAATAATAVFLVTAFWHNWFQESGYLRRLADRKRIVKLVQRVYDAFYLCRRAPDMVARALATSIVAQFAMVIVYFLLGRALGIRASFESYVLVMPLVMIASALPLTPGGAGVREGAVVAYMSVLDVPVTQSLPLALLFDLTIAAWSAVGGLLFLVHPGRRNR